MKCKALHFGVAACLLAVCLSLGCGVSSTSLPASPPPPPAGDFTLSVESQTITVQQGGIAQVQVVQANPTSGFAGEIQIAVTGLPSGVTLSPGGPLSLVVAGVAQGANFQVAASTAASIATSTVTVTGRSGSINHTATFSLAVSPVAPFSIEVSPPQLALAPGTSATVRVSVISQSTNAPQLTVSLPDPNGLVGINFTLPQGFLNPANPVSFIINPTPLAQPLQNYPFTVTASDNSNNSTMVTLSLSVSVPYTSNTTPTRSTFTRTDKSPTGMVYDQARKLVFVSVETLNQVLVLSSLDGHRVASIPVNFPAGIDEAPDGSAIYVVSPYFEGLTIIDPNLMEVVGHASVPAALSQIGQPLTFFQVAALSNGKVMLFPTIDFAAYGLTGGPFFVWDPANKSFTRTGDSTLGFSNLLIARTTDHTKVLASASAGVVIYDATKDAFTAPNTSVGTNLTMSPDGSQIVSLGLQNSATIFYDSNFNQIASMQLDVFPLTGMVYSRDGKHLYVFGQQTGYAANIATVVDTTTFSVVGLVPGFSFGASLPFSGQWITTFDVDEAGMLFGAAFGGVAFLDMNSPTALDQLLPGSFSVQPTLASLSSTTPAQLDGSGFAQNSGLELFIGPPASPASLKATGLSVQSSNFVGLTLPAGTTAGPANVTLTRSDGFFEVIPDAISFGPTILRVDADSASPAGGDAINIFGYGFDSQSLQVSIGGKSQTVPPVSAPTPGQLFPTESVSLKTPPGLTGSVDLTVSTPSGSTTVAGGFHYAKAVNVYPITGALTAVIYDQSRQRLYISNLDHNRVEIFNLASASLAAPIAVGNAPTAIALTPDGSLLAVLNAADNTVSVVDPATLQLKATINVLTAADRNYGTCGGQAINISSVLPHRMLVAVNCASQETSGLFHLIDLDSGVLGCSGVVGCESNGTDMYFGVPGGMASTSDASRIFLTSGYDGPDTLIDFSANTLTSTGFRETNSDAAADSDGTEFAASFGIYDGQLARTSFMAFEPFTDAGSQSFHNVIGEKLNPSGSLLFYPQDSGVDIFDVRSGRLVRHVVLPDPIPLDTNGMALDESGTKMFVISNSGLTIAQLDEEPLSLATVIPASGATGATVTLRGSGFQNGTTVTFGGAQASVTVVNGETLSAIVPSTLVGPQRITVTNPGGHSYSLDNAFASN